MTARLFFGLTVLAASLAGRPALATATYCSAGLQPGGVSVSDLTFRGSSAEDCFGVQAGNDSGANGAFIGWNGFEQLLSDKSGDAIGATRNWMGIDWSLTGAASARNGNFALAWSGANLADISRVLDLVIVGKASDRFVSYLFSDQVFDSSAGTSAGTWNIAFKNNGGAVPKLSHLSVWARVVPVLTVAEPGSLSLLVLGMCAIGVACVWRVPARLIRREGAP